MFSANTLCKKLLDFRHTVIEDALFYDDQDGVCLLRIRDRSDKWHQNFSCRLVGKSPQD